MNGKFQEAVEAYIDENLWKIGVGAGCVILFLLGKYTNFFINGNSVVNYL